MILKTTKQNTGQQEYSVVASVEGPSQTLDCITFLENQTFKLWFLQESFFSPHGKGLSLQQTDSDMKSENMEAILKRNNLCDLTRCFIILFFMLSAHK